MKYVLNLAEDGRVLSVASQLYIPENATIVEAFPEGDLYEYRYVDGEFIHDPLPAQPVEYETPTRLDAIEAQLAYISIMTGLLMEV